MKRTVLAQAPLSALAAESARLVVAMAAAIAVVLVVMAASAETAVMAKDYQAMVMETAAGAME